MNSLRWRIAAWYALLLAAVLLLAGVVVAVRLQSILYDQARARIGGVMDDVGRIAVPAANPFADITESVPPDKVLSSADNLERWASTNTFIQVDSASGATLSKSSNMGDLLFPRNPAVGPKDDTQFRRIVPAGSTSQFLVEDKWFPGLHVPFVVHVGERLDQVNETFARSERAVALIFFFAILAVTGLSVLLGSQATNPLHQLALAMREIGSDRLDRRLKWTRRTDEIGKLAQTFDEMLGRLEEAFARERQFISDASHELKTPLTSINANAQMLARWGDADARIRAESLETIVNETATLAGMVNGMLTLAKADSGDSIPKEPVVLVPVAADAVHSAEARAGEKGLAVRLHPHERSAMVMGDTALIRQLISNLIDNAIKFTDRGSIDVYVKGTATSAIVEVHDTGPGIDVEELPLIFERFYRADKSRNRAIPGTGLGLAIVRSIARVHNGTVAAERLSTGGTCFRVTFPRLQGDLSSNPHDPLPG